MREARLLLSGSEPEVPAESESAGPAGALLALRPRLRAQTNSQTRRYSPRIPPSWKPWCRPHLEGSKEAPFAEELREVSVEEFGENDDSSCFMSTFSVT